MLIEPLQVAPGPPAVLRRRRTFAPNAHGIDASWGQREARFETELAFPVGAKVIHVSEPLATMQAKVPQQDAMRRCPTATVLSPMDIKPMQMLVTPGKQDLQDGMEMRQGGIAGHQHATPDERADATQEDAELIDAEWGSSGSHVLRVAQRIGPLKGSPRYLALSKVGDGG
jgi:hypothetical protein